jgi:hypothetical protein
MTLTQNGLNSAGISQGAATRSAASAIKTARSMVAARVTESTP